MLPSSRWSSPLRVWLIFLGLFNLEDGGSMILWNNGDNCIDSIVLLCRILETHFVCVKLTAWRNHQSAIFVFSENRSASARLQRWCTLLYIFFWVFPRRQIVLADVSEPCISSIFKGWCRVWGVRGSKVFYTPTEVLTRADRTNGEGRHQVVGGSG